MSPEASTPLAVPGEFVAPRVAVATLVVVSFIAYAVLAHFVTTPRIFYDELIYTEAAASLADGNGLSFRDEPYEYGVLYPALIAPLYWAFSDREDAYELTKILNALLFALAAIPVYLLARRLLPPWPSVGAAALSVFVPSSVYVSVVMTEGLAYLTAAWALYAIVRAVERPTVLRQCAALGGIAGAVLTRPQFLAFYVTFLLALVVAILVLPRRSMDLRRSVSALWPTGVSLAAGVTAFLLLPLLRGSAPKEAFGKYDALWRSYDPATVGKWLVYHVADLELYLAVVPLAVAPIVVAWLFARARLGDEQCGAFLAVFASINAVMLPLVAVVVTYQESSGSGVERLHDRYLFYVVPLWLIVLFAWLDMGAPHPFVGTGVGALLAGVLPLGLPLQDLDVNDGAKLFNAVGTGLPAILGKAVDPAFAVGRVIIAVFALALVAAAMRSRRAAGTALSALVLVFALNAALAWGHAFEPPERKVFTGSSLVRRWVDELLPPGSSVTMLHVSCGDATLARDSFVLTEFFNSSVGPVVETGGEFGHSVRLGPDGGVVLRSGETLEADFVVAQPGVSIQGRKLGSGTAAQLALWDVHGPVRIGDVHSADELTRAACTATSV